MSVSDASATSPALTTFLSVDASQPKLPLTPGYQRRLEQWKVPAPFQGLPGQEGIGGLRVPLSYVLLLLNRAALTERFPIAFSTLEKVDEVCDQLTDQGINRTIPVVQATRYCESVAGSPAWTCWLDKTQFDCTCRMMQTNPELILCSGPPSPGSVDRHHECIVLVSGEHMGGYYLFGEQETTHAGLPQQSTGGPRPELRRPDAQAKPSQTAIQDGQAPDYQPYKKLFPRWEESTSDKAPEGQLARCHSKPHWQIANTADDFDRAGHSIVRITKTQATEAGLKDGQLLVVRPALSLEQGANIAAIARLKLTDQGPDCTPAGYRYLEADQIVRDAIGIEIGELAVIAPCEVQRGLRVFEKLIGTPTYVMCRVQSADASTIEREVSLVDELTLQLLGVESGDEVVIEGLPNVDNGDPKIPCLRIKAFRTSDEVLKRRSQLSGGELTCRFPAARDSLGTVLDLPWVFLDSSTRTALGLSGQKLGVVRIRASRRYQLVKEIRELLLIAAVAIIGILSLFSGLARYALIGALAFLALVVVALRMRSRLSRTLNRSVK
jgi:hypothetical protein